MSKTKKNIEKFGDDHYIEMCPLVDHYNDITTTRKKDFRRCDFTKGGGLDWSRHGLDRDLDLDAKKKSVSTIETKSRRSLDWSRRFLCYKISILFLSRSRLSISTVFKSQSRRSRQSLDKSRLVSTSRPPGLIISKLISLSNSFKFSFYL